MINFTVGPVQSSDRVRQIGGMNVPYFRTPEFSEILLENEGLIKEFTNAEQEARALFITGSGTASMEAAVMNCFTRDDKVLIVNGGSFGQRFVDICKIHEIPHEEIKVESGKNLLESQLGSFENQGFTGFLVNIHETSTGVHYNTNLIADFCKRNHCFLIVDAISSFLADEFDMKATGADVMITGSQKALACPPGISIIVLSANAVNRVQSNEVKSLYFDLKNALKDGVRGQTPFTPAVGVLLQINARLHEIKENGGATGEQEKIAYLASYFRNRIKDLPLSIYSESFSNAVTSLETHNVSALEICKVLKDEYGIWVCPNGGALGEKVFRVGHIGCLTTGDYDVLINALDDLVRRGILK
ncbi:MAG: alanine--glyoxylate aminotransferase family protein [Blautia sp.]|nr:alanine--glyoxylate aminotransferase family protein [Blautia sp.]